MAVHIKNNFQSKNKTINTNTSYTFNQEKFNQLKKHVFNNNTKFKTNPQYFNYDIKIKQLEEFKNSSDCQAMWEIAVDKWIRNWNFYREQLTNSRLEKFNMNNKDTKEKQNWTKRHLHRTLPLRCIKITNVKYYELNKISTFKFKPLDLDMTKTEVQLLSKAQAVEIKAYAVTGTIKERVEWCSKHIDYIRAKRPSYYVSVAQRTIKLDADEVRNELARINLLKNTKYKPTRYNVSFKYIANPPLQKKIEDMQGRIQFEFDTTMVPPYG